MGTNIDELLESEARAVEQNKNARLKPGTKISRGHGRTKTLQVRLTEEEYARLESWAEAKNLPMSTMARSLLLSELTDDLADPSTAINRILRELERLRKQIAS